MAKKLDKLDEKQEQLIIKSRSGEVTTWADVLKVLKKLTPAQLKQNAMLLPSSPLPEPLLLEPIIGIGTVKEMCHVKGEIVTETRSADDFQHHPEQIVMLYDGSPFDKDGNSFYTMEDKGLRGNKTGKLYSLGGKVIKEGKKKK